MLMDIFMLSDNVKAKEPAESVGVPPDNCSGEIKDLIEAAKNGDDAAFSSLVGYFDKFVYNTACRVLSASGYSIDSADDISQDSFIKAWRSISSFRGECSFSTWLFRITVNTARDFVRMSARKSTVALSRKDDGSDDEICEWDVPVTSGDTIPEESLERRELILFVRRAIEKLPEEQRTVVVMRDIHELPYQEIAEKLGIELGTVKSRLNRGRANLKTILKKGNFL